VCADAIPDIVAGHAIADMRPQCASQNAADSLTVFDRPVLSGAVVDPHLFAIDRDGQPAAIGSAQDIVRRDIATLDSRQQRLRV
jgi:hypothetical protein